MSKDVIEQINKDSYNISKVDELFSLDDIEHLPSRWTKGYAFEMLVLACFLKNRMFFSDYNPTIFPDWIKHNNGHVGYDVKVKIGDQLVPVEVKYISKPIYDSWLKRDWLSRSAPIIVCNNKWMLSKDQRRMIHDAGKKLFSLDEFVWYVYRKNRRLSSFILTLTNTYLNKGYFMGCFLAGALARETEGVEIYLKLNQLKRLVVKIVHSIANSISEELSRSRRRPCYVLRWLGGVDQTAKKFGRSYFKLIRETLCEVIDRMRLWSIKMKKEDELEFFHNTRRGRHTEHHTKS